MTETFRCDCAPSNLEAPSPADDVLNQMGVERDIFEDAGLYEEASSCAEDVLRRRGEEGADIEVMSESCQLWWNL